jgi:predicted RNA-binding protein with PUA-like domain
MQFESDANIWFYVSIIGERRMAKSIALTTPKAETLRVTGRARILIAEKTDLDLTNLSPAEEKIVEAAAKYVALQRQRRKSAARMLKQLRNRGLKGAAEVAVSKSKPTQGFQALSLADLGRHTYEQIIVDHPEEFSERAKWFARRTLGLPNDSTKPPPKPEGSKGSASAGKEASIEAQYWVFVCNPKTWAIDRFFDRRIEHDTWGVRPSDRARFAQGQLGFVRVGVDRRSAARREGRPPLTPGIYALCEVESEAYDGTGAGDEFWAAGKARQPGWPTIRLRYLRTYLDHPLTIDRLRTERPQTSKLLLNGFQAASFPLPASDFRAILSLLGENEDELPWPAKESEVDVGKLTAIESKYLLASPEVKERISKTIERGPIGALVKQATGFKCQLCDAFGRNPIGFLKKDGEPYVEAHHVTPVSKQQIGSLSASNVMTLCPNHHRQVHYGGIEVVIGATTFHLVIDGRSVSIPKVSLAGSSVTRLKAGAS